MKKIILLLIASLACVCAQAQWDADKIQVSGTSVSRAGEKALVSFSADIAPRAVKSNRTLAYLPVITDGEYQVELPAILISGKRAQKKVQRYEWVSGRVIDYQYTVSAQAGDVFRYRASVPYQPWMEGADLMLEGLEWGCCSAESSPNVLLASGILPGQPKVEAPIVVVEPAPEPVPAPQTTGDTMAETFSFVIPASEWNENEPVYDEDREKALIVYYRQGRNVIEPGYGENRMILTNLVAAVNTIVESADSDVERIVVAGFASPEGAFEVNDRLAWNRAVSVKSYILENTEIGADRITLYNGSEDWRGLRALVAGSAMPEKLQVLNIIDNVPLGEGSKQRLNEIKRLNGGSTYQYLLDHYFPKLRNGAFIRVYYRNK